MAKTNFFEKDKRVYDVKHNREFLNWYKKVIKEGYEPDLTIDEIEKMIECMSTWYYMKLPDRKFQEQEGEKDLDFTNLVDITKYMGFQELLYRLPKKCINLLKGMFRSRYSGSIPIKNSEGRVLGYRPIVGVEVVKNKVEDGTGLSSVILEADADGGLINKEELAKNFPDMTRCNKIDILRDELKNAGNCDVTHLDKVIDNHDKDKALRERIILYTALKILYNSSSKVEYNYQRALNFYSDLKGSLKLDIDTSYLDNLIKEEEKRR